MNSPTQRDKSKGLSVSEITIFAMLGALMYVSKVLMEWAPNVHLLGMFTMVYTIVYRAKALIPIYVYVFINGFFAGFQLWWVPYLYIWTVLWGITMLLPEYPTKISGKKAVILFSVVCALHGLSFGTLYAPAQALFFGMNFKQTLAWIVSGLPWDAVHGIGNFAAGFLIIPLVNLLRKIDRNAVKPAKIATNS